jgi:hypothetical protein
MRFNPEAYIVIIFSSLLKKKYIKLDLVSLSLFDQFYSFGSKSYFYSLG